MLPEGRLLAGLGEVQPGELAVQAASGFVVGKGGFNFVTEVTNVETLFAPLDAYEPAPFFEISGPHLGGRAPLHTLKSGRTLALAFVLVSVVAEIARLSKVFATTIKRVAIMMVYFFCSLRVYKKPMEPDSRSVAFCIALAIAPRELRDVSEICCVNERKFAVSKSNPSSSFDWGRQRSCFAFFQSPGASVRPSALSTARAWSPIGRSEHNAAVNAGLKLRSLLVLSHRSPRPLRLGHALGRLQRREGFHCTLRAA
jgi:hypothetical protein